MSLSETQMSGLKKAGTATITETDLRRVLHALGLRQARTEDGTALRFEMPIEGPWKVQANATQQGMSGKYPVYKLQMCVVNKDTGHSMGTTYETQQATVLQLRGARIMAQLFESVDDLSVFQCGHCEEGKLTWDGKVPANRISKPNVTCPNCGWSGISRGFTAYRTFN